MSAALATLAAELDAKDRELQQKDQDIERICRENGDAMDEIFALRRENERLREALAAAGLALPGGA